MLSLRYYSQIIDNFVEFLPASLYAHVIYMRSCFKLIMTINISLIISIFNVEFHKPDF